ncbi:hypothetical protein P12x_004386 [Tundrisphaera lichenicola]|uniref:hypothetical protein n=1 Tax=Tundrisphaera lichenicola TaxID=2029860 RepID=UPI003EC0420E
MRHGIRMLICALLLWGSGARQAQSQYYYPSGYGYGGYGFGGWGATPQGSIAAGFGAYARGAGVYNYETAEANSINENTVVRYNQYLYNSMLEARRRYNREHARELKMDQANYEARLARIRDNPTPDDIKSGDALNTILDQLSDPKVMSGSSLRLANASVSPAAIKQIPFRDETDAVTISLSQLVNPENWPLPLRSEKFKPEREAYEKSIKEAVDEDAKGSLTPETVTKVRNAVAALSRKVEEEIPKSQQPDHVQATNYLKGLSGMSKMLSKPNVEAVIAELEKVENTTVGNLLAFMHSYNLRFAPAKDPQQEAIYSDLYPQLVSSRDKLIGRPGTNNGDDAPPSQVEEPTGLFHGIDPTHLNSATPSDNPTPPTSDPN